MAGYAGRRLREARPVAGWLSAHELASPRPASPCRHHHSVVAPNASERPCLCSLPVLGHDPLCQPGVMHRSVRNH